MKFVGFALLSVYFSGVICLAQSQSGTVCVAPAPLGQPVTSPAHELMCHSGNLSLRVDQKQAILWPHKNSLRIASLDDTRDHQIRIFCDQKIQQSLSFRFSEFKSNRLCLFISDLYQSAQLWESSRSLSCKCK